ncbi:hypothetical protein TNCV_346901 [Trichonephila clavipes]|nr:hypothetical protein TNCV_346901 [Trichonephila clavipes]
MRDISLRNWESLKVHVYERRTAIQTNLMTLIDDLRVRMPQRRNRRHKFQYVRCDSVIDSGCQIPVLNFLGQTRSSLVVLQGTLTARRYVDDILTPIVEKLPACDQVAHGAAQIYQQDNARPHTAMTLPTMSSKLKMI